MSELQKKIKEHLARVNLVLETETADVRPVDNKGRTGGLTLLNPNLVTVVIPDLHARFFFLNALLKFKIKGKSIQEQLMGGEIQLICVGDGLHSEARARERWKTARIEYSGGFNKSPAMDEEMRENFLTMLLVMKLKIAFPRLFHFLKGNHENIMNENKNGNHPFSKFAVEGIMTKLWVEKNMGYKFLDAYDRFEKNLPLLALGKHFIISHSQPSRTFSQDEIINSRSLPEVIEGLTWSRNQNALSGGSKSMLENFLANSGNLPAFWLAGHTAINRLYKHIEKENLYFFHNPNLMVTATIDPYRPFDPQSDIFDLGRI